MHNFCDLGAQIDSKLKFHIHTDTTVTYIIKRLIALWVLFASHLSVRIDKVVCPIGDFYGDLPTYVVSYLTIKKQRIQPKETRTNPFISRLATILQQIGTLKLAISKHFQWRGNLIYLYGILKDNHDIDNYLPLHYNKRPHKEISYSSIIQIYTHARSNFIVTEKLIIGIYYPNLLSILPL